MSSFTDPLILKVHTGALAERPFELLQEFKYWSTIGASAEQPRWITVPAGYRTDFASIPRWVWPIFPPVGRCGKAAVIHDWLCDEQPHSVDSQMAADIFDEAMIVLGEPSWRRQIMVWTVKLFGPRFHAHEQAPQ
jgi:hypothetical protein